MLSKTKVTKGRSQVRRRPTEFGGLPLEPPEVTMTMPDKHIKPLKNGPRGHTEDESRARPNRDLSDVHVWRADVEEQRQKDLEEFMRKSPLRAAAQNKKAQTTIDASSTRGSSIFPASECHSRSPNSNVARCKMTRAHYVCAPSLTSSSPTASQT
jgi:hypothetical protein